MGKRQLQKKMPLPLPLPLPVLMAHWPAIHDQAHQHATHPDHGDPHLFHPYRNGHWPSGTLGSIGRIDSPETAPRIRLCVGDVHVGCGAFELVYQRLPTAQPLGLHPDSFACSCHVVEFVPIISLFGPRQYSGSSKNHAMALCFGLHRDGSLHAVTQSVFRSVGLGSVAGLALKHPTDGRAWFSQKNHPAK